MKTIITADVALAKAFADCDYISAEAISEADLFAAERRTLLPVVGEQMYAALFEGKYEQFVGDYVEDIVALSVRIAMQPLFDQRSGRFGSTVVSDQGQTAASQEQIIARMAALRKKLSALLWRMTDHLNENGGVYSEYDASQNVLYRVNLEGGMVLC